MKTIDRLLQRVKRLPKPDISAFVVPWRGGWSCTINNVRGNVWHGGSVESKEKGFTTKGAAMVWGRANMPKGSLLRHVCMIDMQHKDVSENIGRVKGSGHKLKGGGVYARYETETAIYKVTRPGRKL